MTTQITSKLFILNHRELAFLQKITQAEYQFITDEEQTARQSLRDKLNEVVLNPQQNRIAVNLTSAELIFLAHLVHENFSFVTSHEKAARDVLEARLDTASKFGMTA